MHMNRVNWKSQGVDCVVRGDKVRYQLGLGLPRVWLDVTENDVIWDGWLWWHTVSWNMNIEIIQSYYWATRRLNLIGVHHSCLWLADNLAACLFACCLSRIFCWCLLDVVVAVMFRTLLLMSELAGFYGEWNLRPPFRLYSALGRILVSNVFCVICVKINTREVSVVH